MRVVIGRCLEECAEKLVLCAMHHGSFLIDWVCSMADHAALVSMLATRQSIDEAIRIHSVSRESPNVPTVLACDLITPNSVSDVNKSPQADVRRYSMNNEFGGLLQADTFAPAPA